MPDLIYNVKFEIDSASAEKVGQIVDSSNSQDIKILQKEVERLNNILKESRVENGKVNKSVKEKILAYKEEVASLKLLDSKINKSIQVYGEFSDETMSLVSDLKIQSQAVDNTGQELLELANASDRTTGEVIVLTNAVSTGNRAMVAGAKRAREMASAQSIMEGQMGEGIKTFSAGNQAIFSFSDLIQDSTQFSYGFATGMRAIGNNISFTAELLAYLSREAKASGQTLRQSLLASLKGVNGVVLALNFAVTVGTILLEKFGSKQKEASEATKGLNGNLSEQELAFKRITSSGQQYLQFVSEFVSGLDEANKVFVTSDIALLRSIGDISLSNQKLLVEERINLLQLSQQQRIEEERDLQRQLEALKTSEVALRIKRFEGSTLQERIQLDNDIFEIQQKISNLESKKSDNIQEINELQKEQIRIGEALSAQEESRIALLQRSRPFIEPQIRTEEVIDNIQEIMEGLGTNIPPFVVPVRFEPEMRMIGGVPVEVLDIMSDIESSIGKLPDLSFIDDPSLDFGTLASDLSLMRDLQNDFLAAKTDEERKSVAASIKLKQQEIDSKRALIKQDEKNNKASIKAIAQTAASILPSLFEDQKASAIASALVNAGSAIVRQYADLPLLAAIPASIATAAATQKQIQKIQNTKFGDKGGSVSGGGGGGKSPISSSASGVTQPTQSITFLPNAASSGQAPPTVDVKIDRAGLAVAVNKGNRELANKQVRV